MLITEVTETMLPLFLIEVKPQKDTQELGYETERWNVFTCEPFGTQEKADAHRLLILKEYPTLKPENVRVSPYTRDRWRNDLIEAMFQNPEALQRALSLLRNNTLLQLLRGDGYKPPETEPCVVLWTYLHENSTSQSVFGPFANSQIAYHWAESQAVDETTNGGYMVRSLNAPRE